MAERFLDRLARRIAAEESTPLPLPLAASLTVLSLVYGGLYTMARLPYRIGLRRPVRMGVPAISLGNLAAGGTGKTPCAIWLAGMLQRAGRRVVVVSHNYRAGEDGPLVVSDGGSIGDWPASAGDEARLVAVSCPGVPVVAGRNRIAAAGLAIRRFAPDLLLLDDAFQHWRIHRHLDLVLLDGAAPFGNGRLIPRGFLREPKAALCRADGLILVGGGAGLPPQAGRDVFWADVVPVSLTPWRDWRRGMRAPLPAKGGVADAFCGLARPERFLATLSAFGWSVRRRLLLPDHAAPEPEELRNWAAAGAGPIVTTEKDAIKLAAEAAASLDRCGRELLVLGIEFRPVGEGLWTFVMSKI